MRPPAGGIALSDPRGEPEDVHRTRAGAELGQTVPDSLGGKPLCLTRSFERLQAERELRRKHR